VTQVVDQGEMPVGRRERDAGREQVGIPAAEVRGAGAAHRLAAAHDPIAVDEEPPAHFFDHGEDVVLADAAILGSASPMRADHGDAPFLGLRLVHPVAVGRMVEVLVLVAARTVQGDEQGQSLGAVVGRGQIEPEGLIRVVDRRSVRKG